MLSIERECYTKTNAIMFLIYLWYYIFAKNIKNEYCKVKIGGIRVRFLSNANPTREQSTSGIGAGMQLLRPSLA
jgi:hypothetical protein